MHTPEIQDPGRPVLPALSPSDRERSPGPPARIATWPGNGELPPRKARPTPLPLLAAKPRPPSPKALARRQAKQAEVARTFAGVAPGAHLPQFGQRQRLLARGRLSLPYARALRLVAWQMGRRSGRVPITPATLARVEEVAAQYRAKEAARRRAAVPQTEASLGYMLNRALYYFRKARRRGEDIIIHRRQWDVRSRKKDAADRRAMEERRHPFGVRTMPWGPWSGTEIRSISEAKFRALAERLLADSTPLYRDEWPASQGNVRKEA